MSYYLSKYVGKYRIMPEIDKSTNDFPRDADGKIEQIDAYIKCRNDARIYHYGKNILVCYVPSLMRGRNVLKSLAENAGLNLNDYAKTPFDYEELYRDLTKTNVVLYIEETDSEVLWRYSDKYTEMMATLLGAQTLGSKRSPYSTKNLPKKKYALDSAKNEAYKEITDRISPDDKLILHRLTTQFICDYIPSHYKAYSKVDMKKLMKKQMLKGKEFIDELGYWDAYIKFLKENLKTVL